MTSDLRVLSSMTLPPPRSTLFPYTTLFRSLLADALHLLEDVAGLHDAESGGRLVHEHDALRPGHRAADGDALRSEEHTSELQSQSNLVCRLLLEKKNNQRTPRTVVRVDDDG